MPDFGWSATIGLAALLTGPALAEAPPRPRPPAVPQLTRPQQQPQPEPAGALCGDSGLRGERLAAIAEEGDCVVDAPVRLVSAAGVALEPPAVVACETAHAMIAWLKGAAITVFADKGVELEALVVADAYSCRNRNRASNGKLSEHALGHAIDIGAFRLRDGRTVTIRDGWSSPDWDATLRRLRDAGCGPFGTVLGPGSNPLHADHFHFDMEVRRSGPWCE